MTGRPVRPTPVSGASRQKQFPSSEAELIDNIKGCAEFSNHTAAPVSGPRRIAFRMMIAMTKLWIDFDSIHCASLLRLALTFGFSNMANKSFSPIGSWTISGCAVFQRETARMFQKSNPSDLLQHLQWLEYLGRLGFSFDRRGL